MGSPSKVEARLKHSRRCRHCQSSIPSLNKTAEAIATASGTMLSRATADVGASQQGYAYPRAIGMLDELLPSLASVVVGFCNSFCECAHARRQQKEAAHG